MAQGMSFLALTLTLLLAAGDEAEPVAMVLSVKGDVKLRPMDLVRSGDEVRVPASGNVRLVFLADGHRETLNSGRTVKITESGGTPAEAVMREKAELPAGRLDGLRAMAASARAGVSRVRDLGAPPRPLSPISGSVVKSVRPDFAWTAVQDVEWYDVQLFRGEVQSKESLVWSARAAKDHFEYPKDRPALERDAIFTWNVSTPGKEVVAKGMFMVATEEEARDFAAVEKLSQSPEFADRLLAAVLFEAGLVYDESHRLFEKLVKELPKEPWLLLAHARHLGRLGRTQEGMRLEKQALALAGGAR
jgi:hypothetical protein